ncbi:MAG: uroporphyrinogen decarboxylase family protein [Kiritimatiellales bacterium]
MSRQRALDAINGRMSDRIPQYDSPDNILLAQKIVSYDIWKDPERTMLDLLKYYDIDMMHFIPNRTAEWNFPLVRYYNDAEYIENSDTLPYLNVYKNPADKPYRSMYDNLQMQCSASFWGLSPTLAMKKYCFDSPEDVLEFNPLEHDTFSFDERKDFFRRYYKQKQDLLGDSGLFIGWYYHTLFMWPVEIFGWENFMLAAMSDPERFAEILDQFFELTKRDVLAMAQVPDLPLIGCHDDLCNANGPMFNPGWYREFIYDRYSELTHALRDAGKKSLFVCDGNVVPVLDDLVTVGFDGIGIDGHSDLEAVIKVFTGKIITGGLRASVVSNGTPEEIESMVKKTAALVKDEPGYFFKSSGMSGRTSLQNIDHYQKCIQLYGQR